jgi:hypothetical protein
VGGNTNTSGLTYESFMKSMQEWRNSTQTYTKEVWRELAARRGHPVLLVGAEESIIALEQALSLDKDARPSWVKASRFIPAHHQDGQMQYFFLACQCPCHTVRSELFHAIMPPGHRCNCSASEE